MLVREAADGSVKPKGGIGVKELNNIGGRFLEFQTSSLATNVVKPWRRACSQRRFSHCSLMGQPSPVVDPMAVDPCALNSFSYQCQQKSGVFSKGSLFILLDKSTSPY